MLVDSILKENQTRERLVIEQQGLPKKNFVIDFMHLSCRCLYSHVKHSATAKSDRFNKICLALFSTSTKAQYSQQSDMTLTFVPSTVFSGAQNKSPAFLGCSIHSPRQIRPSLRSTVPKVVCLSSATEDMQWVDAISTSEVSVGGLHRRLVAGLDLVFACDTDGQVYALGNKGTPLGTPLSDGRIVSDELVSHSNIP